MVTTGIVVFCAIVTAGTGLLIAQTMKKIEIEQNNKIKEMEDLLVRVCSDVNLTDGKIWNDTKRKLRDWESTQ